LRYYLIGVHYRNDFNFNEDDLQVAKKRLDKLYRLKNRLAPISLSIPSEEFKKALLDAMSDDLNISVALSVIDAMIASANEKLDLNPKDKALKSETAANIRLIDELLGFGGKIPTEYFQIGIDEELKRETERLISKRTEAKKAKDFAASDAIRNQLDAMGIRIMDTSDGTTWEKL
jgi:cysteinyl-tRNA synthetase